MLYPIKWCFVQRCRTSSTLHLPLLPHSLPRWCATVYQRNCAHWLYIQAPHLRMSGKPHMSLCIWMCALLSRTDTGSCMGKPALTKNRWFRRYSVLVVALRYSMRMMHKLINNKCNKANVIIERSEPSHFYSNEKKFLNMQAPALCFSLSGSSSGWNCTPNQRFSELPMAWTLQAAELARTSNIAGTLVTSSEWS